MIPRKSLPTFERVKEVFTYEDILGRLIWRHRPGNTQAINSWNAKNFGKIAGTPYTNGYRSIKLDGRTFLEHRLVWLYIHGEAPERDLDHINGVRDDNRIDNLRVVGARQNIQNQKLRRDNVTGFKGVITRANSKNFGARITVDGNRYIIGWYRTPQEAHAAYCEEARKNFGEFARSA